MIIILILQPGMFLVRLPSVRDDQMSADGHKYTVEMVNTNFEFRKLKIVKENDKYNFENSEQEVSDTHCYGVKLMSGDIHIE